MNLNRKDSEGRIEIDIHSLAECLLARNIEANGDYRVEIILEDNCKRMFLVRNDKGVDL